MASTILLADDSPHARRMGTQYLNDLGYTVATAQDGPEALARLEELSRRQTPPVLILADAALPGCPGVELARQVKQRAEWRHIPVLILLGALAPAAGLESADGALRKPLSSAGLQRWLQHSPQEMLRLAVLDAVTSS